MAETISEKPQGWRIVNAQALLPEGQVACAELATEGARIDTADKTARIFDASGLVLLPGVVDLHGDELDDALAWIESRRCAPMWPTMSMRSQQRMRDSRRHRAACGRSRN
jgi:alpha-D-ribose 1-methylphosphonate 5-triphosphate diphosphatase PhnM